MEPNLHFACSNLIESENVQIENQMNVTVVFPDKTLPEQTKGTFESQEEFRNFILQHQKDGTWESLLQCRPKKTRLPDYLDENVAKAFTL